MFNLVHFSKTNFLIVITIKKLIKIIIKQSMVFKTLTTNSITETKLKPISIPEKINNV
jgi:hypothetical protein